MYCNVASFKVNCLESGKNQGSWSGSMLMSSCNNVLAVVSCAPYQAGTAHVPPTMMDVGNSCFPHLKILCLFFMYHWMMDSCLLLPKYDYHSNSTLLWVVYVKTRKSDLWKPLLLLLLLLSFYYHHYIHYYNVTLTFPQSRIFVSIWWFLIKQ